MAIGGIILIIGLLYGIYYIRTKFNKLFPESEQSKLNRIERYNRRKRKQDHYDYWDAQIQARENAENRKFLQNPTGLGFVGNNSRVKKMRDYW